MNITLLEHTKSNYVPDFWPFCCNNIAVNTHKSIMSTSKPKALLWKRNILIMRLPDRVFSCSVNAINGYDDMEDVR